MQRICRAFTVLTLPLCVLTATQLVAQTYTPLKNIPGQELMRRMQSAMSGIGEGGSVGDVRWDSTAGELWFEKDGWKTLHLANGEVHDAAKDAQPPESAQPSRSGRNGGERRPARGRQFTSTESPDGAWTAISEQGNLFLQPTKGERIAVTSDGTDDLKYGQASWVYGEELDQTTAMWWSPDSRFIAYYKFDESQVKDFYILGGWTDTNTRIMSEAYPKPGGANPTAYLMVYDLAAKKQIEIDAFSVASGATEGTEYYFYNVLWTPDGSELLFSRTPRRQDVLDVLAANPTTGLTRLVVQEKQDTWQENRPLMRFLKDGTRFIWETEKTGFKHYELRTLGSASDAPALLATLSSGAWPVESIVQIDEEAGELWFTAWSGDIAVQQQLHCARIDGKNAVRSTRVTTEDLHHSNFRISPDGAHVVADGETTQIPAKALVYSREGNLLATLAQGSVKGFTTHELTPTELFTCLAADGKTTLYGKINFPPAFDATKKYPVIVETYGGPTIRLVTDRFSAGDTTSALGFIVVVVDNRGTPGRGKAFESAAYLKLGVVDADDQAAAVQHLATTRSYIDGARVGITGHSYGGYMSAICAVRRGDVFAAAVAGAPPTDWRNYDTIYTERYMRTPQENAEGYDAGSCVKLASKLESKLLLLHGMMDDNVHPNNTFQLANALQSVNRPFAMMLFPNGTHSIGSPAEQSVKWSFFVEALAPIAPDWPSKKPAATATLKAETK
jgi:dipeptidyl-peptidase-4